MFEAIFWGFAVLVMGCSLITSVYRLFNWPQLKGRVVSVDTQLDGEGFKSTYITAQYCVNGVFYLSKPMHVQFSLRVYRVGSEVILLYNEESPTNCEIKNPMGVFFLILAYLFFILPMALIMGSQ
jgi:Protein of unknown function (DUF3592)